MPLTPFLDSLQGPDILATLRAGLIGRDRTVPGTGRRLLYADHVASGRALAQVEDFIRDHVLPWYANTHSEDSYCGARTTRLREAARQAIARQTGAGEDCAVIFTGAGATAGLNRLPGLLGLDRAKRAVVLHGPYEHHSNILPWRESGARVVEIPEGPAGGPDPDALERALRAHAGADLVVGSFSAVSNVTGIVTDTVQVTRILRRHGALAVWDYAAGAPYLPIDMGNGTDAAKDAVVLSAHKFPGGPGASGVLILRREAVRRARPVWPGGGSVAYVSPWGHDYLADVVQREEAGTPNIPGDIRAGLVFLVRQAVGQATITAREERLNRMALAAWQGIANMQILGLGQGPRLPIFSFLLRDGRGRIVPHGLVVRRLDRDYGVQARGGCACAGPYGHRLLGVDRARSEAIRARVMAGHEDEKPGWVRLNLSWLMDDSEAQAVIDAVADLAGRCARGEVTAERAA